MAAVSIGLLSNTTGMSGHSELPRALTAPVRHSNGDYTACIDNVQFTRRIVDCKCGHAVASALEQPVELPAHRRCQIRREHKRPLWMASSKVLTSVM